MRILVTAASKHGATAEIAARLGTDLREAGLDAEVLAIEHVTDLAPYNAVVLGSGVYVGRWLPEAKAFVDRHAARLAEMPVWLFSSGPIGSPEVKPAGNPEGVQPIVEALSPRDHKVFAGSVDRSKLSFGERAVMLAVRAPYGDFRDWAEVNAWARAIALELVGEPATV